MCRHPIIPNFQYRPDPEDAPMLQLNDDEEEQDFMNEYYETDTSKQTN